MEMKTALILDGSEPLSKALGGFLETNTAVIVSKSGKYYGIIDDRNLRDAGENPSKVKCETVAVKPPILSPESSVWESTEAFLGGRYKALPVVDKSNKPVGIVTSVEVLKALLDLGAIPKLSVKNLTSMPIYSIEETKSVREAKTKMKEYDAKHILVTRSGRPIGLFSTLDLAVFALKPKESKRNVRGVVETTKAQDDQPIARFFRPNLVSIADKSTVEDATRQMIKRDVSNLIVMEADKPLGIISAQDIFKWISKTAQKDEVPVEISGLNEETKRFYGDIVESVNTAVKKFRKAFGIEGVTVHVRELKSVYTVKMHFHGNETFVVSAEGPTLEETLSMTIAEIKKIYGRKKGFERDLKIKRRRGKA